MFAAFRMINATRARVLIQHDYLSPYSTPQCDGPQEGATPGRPASVKHSVQDNSYHIYRHHTHMSTSHTYIYIYIYIYAC